MKKRDFNLVGNEGTDNQELAKGIAFVKSRRAELNVVQMVESMRDQAIPNGVIIIIKDLLDIQKEQRCIQ